MKPNQECRKRNPCHPLEADTYPTPQPPVRNPIKGAEKYNPCHTFEGETYPQPPLRSPSGGQKVQRLPHVRRWPLHATTSGQSLWSAESATPATRQRLTSTRNHLFNHCCASPFSRVPTRDPCQTLGADTYLQPISATTSAQPLGNAETSTPATRWRLTRIRNHLCATPFSGVPKLPPLPDGRGLTGTSSAQLFECTANCNP